MRRLLYITFTLHTKNSNVLYLDILVGCANLLKLEHTYCHTIVQRQTFRTHILPYYRTAPNFRNTHTAILSYSAKLSEHTYCHTIVQRQTFGTHILPYYRTAPNFRNTHTAILSYSAKLSEHTYCHTIVQRQTFGTHILPYYRTAPNFRNTHTAILSYNFRGLAFLKNLRNQFPQIKDSVISVASMRYHPYGVLKLPGASFSRFDANPWKMRKLCA